MTSRSSRVLSLLRSDNVGLKEEDRAEATAFLWEVDPHRRLELLAVYNPSYVDEEHRWAELSKRLLDLRGRNAARSVARSIRLTIERAGSGVWR